MNDQFPGLPYGQYPPLPQSNIRTCRRCGTEIMLTGERWYRARVADINGYCPGSDDDLHSPEGERM